MSENHLAQSIDHCVISSRFAIQPIACKQEPAMRTVNHGIRAFFAGIGPDGNATLIITEMVIIDHFNCQNGLDPYCPISHNMLVRCEFKDMFVSNLKVIGQRQAVLTLPATIDSNGKQHERRYGNPYDRLSSHIRLQECNIAPNLRPRIVASTASHPKTCSDVCKITEPIGTISARRS